MNPEFKQSFIKGLKRGIPTVLILLAAMFVLAYVTSCGRAGDPVYPKDTMYPRSYPNE